MKCANVVLALALSLAFVVPAFAQSAFMAMGVDPETNLQKMYSVVVAPYPVYIDITYQQENNRGWVGDPEVYCNPENECEVWSDVPLSPEDVGRATDLDPGELQVILATIDVYDRDTRVLLTTLEVRDSLVAVLGNDGSIRYAYMDPCVPVLPDIIRHSSSFCAWICHGTYSVPIFCEDPGYNPALLEVTVTNGCDPSETNCNDPYCPRIDWNVFRWYKRVLPNCRLYLTMTYCDAAPGCVCIWRSDFWLPVEMIPGSFVATPGNGQVRLSWATASESNTQRFIITRSDTRNGVPHTVGNVTAAGSSSTRHDYAFTDRDVQNGRTYYYRLHVMDANGTHVYGDADGAYVCAATPNAGSSSVPTEFSLAQNWPNPFNSQTNFTFAIPTDARATLRVYDLMGREVATVVDRHLVANTYTMSWSADGLPAGVYMYKLTAGPYSATDKLLYLK
jgi:hypothetical protein